MKKYLAAIFALVVGVVMLVPVRPVEAQVVYGNKCCDAWARPRCFVPVMPVGTGCYCDGIPGVGYVC